jgi:peptidoglycan/xylan/chitin deacetylase (PgdA/CDA1 family)
MLKTLTRLVGDKVSPGGRDGRLSILMYHRLLPCADPILQGAVHAEAFDKQMDAIKTHFNCLPLGAEAVSRLRDGTLPPRAVCVTFDDGYRDNVEIALPILLRHRVPATFFIATGYLDGGRMFNDIVIEALHQAQRAEIDLSDLGLPRFPLATPSHRRLAIDAILRHAKYLTAPERTRFADCVAARAGVSPTAGLMMDAEQLHTLVRADMEIGAHTVTHPMLSQSDPRDARNEIAASKAQLEALTGRPVRVFAYPNGIPGRDYGAEHVAMVREAGFEAAVSTSWGSATRDSDLYQLPRFTPWDRTPLRFAARMLHNCAVNRPVYA